jgi:hypothetical protein
MVQLRLAGNAINLNAQKQSRPEGDSRDRQIGVVGVTHGWELDRRFVESVSAPVIIAGGLGPEKPRNRARKIMRSNTRRDWRTSTAMATRQQRISAFIYEGDPPADQPVELLCEDHIGTYVIPFLCRLSSGAWQSVDTGSRIEATVIGWRVR